MDIDLKRTHDLTIDEVKASPLFRHLTDDEALQVIETLKIFTKIAYDVYKLNGAKREIEADNSYLKGIERH